MRSKQPKPSRFYNKYRGYDSDALLEALGAVQRGLSVRKAAAQFGVPRTTLADRVSGRIGGTLKNQETLFNRDEELTIVEYLESLAQLGYGATRSRLKDMGGDLAFTLGKRGRNRALSNDWVSGFLQRWKARLSSVRPSGLETFRAKYATPESVDNYFKNLGETLKQYNFLNKPQCIFNLDETGIQPEHRPPAIIAPISKKAQSVTSPRSSTTTVIGCVNAIGNHLPPFSVFKGKRENHDLMKGTSPGSGFCMSEIGWSNGKVLKCYLQNHFIPCIRRGDNSNEPILLLFDGHSSHTSKDMIQWAISQNIILFVLPAHTSHLLQPLDVAVFGPFKGHYYRECAAYMHRNMGKSVTKYEMAEIACSAYLKAMTPANIVSGFRKTGIYPFNQEAIQTEKLFPCEAFRDETPLQKVTAIKNGKEAIDKYFKDKYVLQQNGPNSPKTNTKESKCSCKKVSMKKPKSSGKQITESTFLQELIEYENTKEKRMDIVQKSPQPSTSGLNNHSKNSLVMSDDSMSDDDSEVCCVCLSFYPPSENKPHLKIVNWAFCDQCDHCVHLSFCHEKRAIRTGDTFLCPHCV